MRLVRVTAPHFVAAMVVTKGRITEAAPILKWAIGKTWSHCERYFRRKGYTWMVISAS